MVRCDRSNTPWSIRHPVWPHGSKDQWNSCSRRMPSKPTLGPPHQWLKGEITGRPTLTIPFPFGSFSSRSCSVLFTTCKATVGPVTLTSASQTHDVLSSLMSGFTAKEEPHRDEGHSGHSRTLSTDELHPKNTLRNAVYLLNETDCVQSQSNKREQ
jgi:hypothetical protein